MDGQAPQPHLRVDLHDLVESRQLDTRVISVIGRVQSFRVAENMLELACVAPACADATCWIAIDASMIEPMLLLPGSLVKVFAERTSVDGSRTFRATIIKPLDGMDTVAYRKVVKARNDYFGGRLQEKGPS